MSFEDAKLPQSLVNKIISNAAPPSCSATKDFKSALNVAGVVFIHYITALASAKASDSGKATLSLDHVLDALKDAGFEDMVGAVALQVNAFKEQQSEKKRCAAEASAGGSKKQKSDSLAEEDGGDDEDEEEDGNEDGAGSEEEQNGDGENDDA